MEEIIRVENLLQVVKGKTILNQVSFSVGEGEAFGLFGPRGAGKTSLLHILAGIDRFTSGRVQVFKADVNKTEKFKKQLGLVTQVPSLFGDLSAKENLDFLAALKGVPRSSVAEAVEGLELEGCLNRRVGKISPGEYGRLALACAMLGRPPLLLLDNFADNLDPDSLRLIYDKVAGFHQEGGTIVFVISRPEAFSAAARVGFLKAQGMEVLEPEAAAGLWREQMDYVSGGRGSHA